MLIARQKRVLSFSQKLIITLAATFLLIIVSILYFSWQFTQNQLKDDLENLTAIIKSDISYQDGQWDITKYLNDSQIPNNLPLYIITSEGFVIDRRNIIPNFLDTSDLRFSSSFQIPQTIVSPVGETWFMYSKPITRDRLTYGTILLAYHQPEYSSINEIEIQLKDLGRMIDSQININQNNLDLTTFDHKTVSSKISYQIVDTENKVLTTSGPIPSYVDRSYLALYKKLEFLRFGEYLVHTSPITKDNRQLGVIISALKTEDIPLMLVNRAIIPLAVGILILVLAAYILSRNKSTPTAQNYLLTFSRKDSTLSYQNKTINIPLDSNQYYVLVALFSKPQKRWETDELAEIIFGQDYIENMKIYWRKIYDAVRSINQKTTNTFGQKIIETESKTFRLRSHLVDSI